MKDPVIRTKKRHKLVPGNYYVRAYFTINDDGFIVFEDGHFHPGDNGFLKLPNGDLVWPFFEWRWFGPECRWKVRLPGEIAFRKVIVKDAKIL